MDYLTASLNALEANLEVAIASSPDDLDLQLAQASIQLSLIAFRLHGTLAHRATTQRLKDYINALPLAATA